jgi:hypothetical protein
MSTLAERQLAAWERLAGQPMESEVPVIILRCDRPLATGFPCGKSVAVLTDNYGRRHHYTHEDMLALVVLHLRNHHPGLDPDKG